MFLTILVVISLVTVNFSYR